MEPTYRTFLDYARSIFTTAIIALYPLVVFGEQLTIGGAPTSSELKSLPPYCEAKYNNQNILYWQKTYGHLFQSIRHYCAGLNYMNRYHRNAPGYKPGTWLSNAILEFNYMLNSPPMNHPLVPEIFLNRAVAFGLSGQDEKAISDFYKSLELNPRYGKGYIELANYFYRKNLKDKALEIVTQGLRRLPDDKALQRLFMRYGGNLPYPTPLETLNAHSKNTQIGASETPGESKVAVEAKPSIGPLTPPDTATSPKSDMPSSDTGQIPTQSIGKSKNPWCRFCPE